MDTGTKTDEVVAVRRVAAPAERVFGVLTDPGSHAAVAGTGWVREPLDSERLTAVGQVFGMSMFHSGHPDGDHLIHNRVEVLEAPRAIAWQPGSSGPDGTIAYGGWLWRYDLEPDGDDACRVTLTYDWSGASASVREWMTFPPFDPDHLERSLANLARLAG
jgi:uncharacterized protein YndB with AHSA1/START domain